MVMYITNKDTVAILLLNWNGHADTIECLDSLKNINYPNYKIFLVDNNSKKTSVDTIKEYLKNQDYYIYDVATSKDLSKYSMDEKTNLLFILNDNNAGFAGGNNVALRYFIERKPTDYVLLLNNDTVVSEDFLDALLDKIKEEQDIGFVGITHYYYDEKDRIQTVGGGKVDYVHGESMAVTKKGTKYFDFITGSCILLSTQLLCKIGPIREDYFMYWEDVDWSTQARKKGYNLTVADYGCIYHKEGSSIKSLNRIYYHTRNRIRYMRYNTTKKEYHKFLIYITLFVLKESLTNMIKDRNYSKTLIKGFVDAFK